MEIPKLDVAGSIPVARSNDDEKLQGTGSPSFPCCPHPMLPLFPCSQADFVHARRQI